MFKRDWVMFGEKPYEKYVVLEDIVYIVNSSDNCRVSLFNGCEICLPVDAEDLVEMINNRRRRLNEELSDE